MKRRGHNPEQVIRKLREADRLLAKGREIPEVANVAQAAAAGNVHHTSGPAGRPASRSRVGAGGPVRPDHRREVLKLRNVVDEHTREALTITADRRIDADATVPVLDRLAALRGYPAVVRCDIHPEWRADGACGGRPAV
jgi:hypothetical protein